jgi:hypothetical protein
VLCEVGYIYIGANDGGGVAAGGDREIAGGRGHLKRRERLEDFVFALQCPECVSTVFVCEGVALGGFYEYGMRGLGHYRQGDEHGPARGDVEKVYGEIVCAKEIEVVVRGDGGQSGGLGKVGCMGGVAGVVTVG